MNDSWYNITSSVLMLIVVFLAPFFAVWAQGRILKDTEIRKRKKDLFETLMATRQNRTSLEHVKALNMIEVVFDPKVKKEKKVINSWRIYHDSLKTNNPRYYEDQNVRDSVHAKRDDLFIDLLHELSECLDFSFNKVDIKNYAYAPQGHIDDAETDRLARIALIRMAGKDGVIRTQTVMWPGDTPEKQDAAEEFAKSLKNFFDGKTSIPIREDSKDD
jgi:hypothetical protein